MTPSLSGGRVCVCCSDAILKYLATKYNAPEHWYPRQPERRARVDEYTAWHHSNTRPHAATVFILEVHTHTHTQSVLRYLFDLCPLSLIV